jgi:hypothetical protein
VVDAFPGRSHKPTWGGPALHPSDLWFEENWPRGASDDQRAAVKMQAIKLGCLKFESEWGACPKKTHALTTVSSEARAKAANQDQKQFRM